MASAGELEVVAAGEERVRNYLRGLHMPEYDISLYVDEARRGPGPATFSFGAGDMGIIPEFRLSLDDSEYVLMQRIT
jgi:hypothetical protein